MKWSTVRTRHLNLACAFFLLFAAVPELWAWDISGSVFVDGIPQDRYTQVPPSEWQACGMIKKVDDLAVGPQGQLKNAVVWLDYDFPAEEKSRVKASRVEFVDQKQCDFVPRVVTVPAGGRVIFRSSDAVRHGVAGFDPSGKNEFDLLIDHPGQTVETAYDVPGPHYMRCGFHAWMGGIVYVTQHPFYAVTDENGSFRFSGMPERPYQIRVWHERMGETGGEILPPQSNVNLIYKRPEVNT